MDDTILSSTSPDDNTTKPDRDTLDMAGLLSCEHSREDWELMRAKITTLYLQPYLSLTDVIEIMTNHYAFRAT